jgi:hypothetical protein
MIRKTLLAINRDLNSVTSDQEFSLMLLDLYKVILEKVHFKERKT